eukprot:scaffold33525_cov118-Isochrysis_galbana.AAC.3
MFVFGFRAARHSRPPEQRVSLVETAPDGTPPPMVSVVKHSFSVGRLIAGTCWPAGRTAAAAASPPKRPGPPRPPALVGCQWRLDGTTAGW